MYVLVLVSRDECKALLFFNVKFKIIKNVSFFHAEAFTVFSPFKLKDSREKLASGLKYIEYKA